MKNTKIKTISPQRLDPKTIEKAVGFFIVLAVVLIGVTLLKLEVSPSVEIEWASGMHALAAVGILFFLASLLFYLLYTRSELLKDSKEFYTIGTVLAICYIAGLFLEKLSIFAVPTALTAFVLAPLLKRRRDAFIANLFCNFLFLSIFLIEAYFAVAGSPEASSYRMIDVMIMFQVGVCAGSVASYLAHAKKGRLRHILTSLAIGLGTYSLILLYGGIMSGLRGYYATEGFLGSFIGEVAVFAILPALAPLFLMLLLSPLLEISFNLLTDTRLVDLTDYNRPLLKRLREETPGTFFHSQAVASFAEICASAIGENPYLARAAALYHDVGKLENPTYYKENQGEKNLHDELLPEVSVDIIRAHTSDGLRLCQKHRIPKEIQEIAIQHHGTTAIQLFYEKAKGLTDGEVDILDYSYKGDTPKTKIAAIIMLCDVAEAAIRAIDSSDSERIDKVLTSIIDERIRQKQFDYCDITLGELRIIKDTIINAHGGLYHTRLKYPQKAK